MPTTTSVDHTFLSPGPTYIAPSSSFFFSSGSASASLIDFLPSRTVADRLLDQYWDSVHPMCRLVHKPSFERRCSIFWDDVQMGIEPANSLQAVVFAAMFSGVVSMSEEAILLEFGVSKKDLVDNFQLGTETALGRANIIRTTKIETLQAFIMYMVRCLYIDREMSSFFKISRAAAFTCPCARGVMFLTIYRSSEIQWQSIPPPSLFVLSLSDPPNSK